MRPVTSIRALSATSDTFFSVTALPSGTISTSPVNVRPPLTISTPWSATSSTDTISTGGLLAGSDVEPLPIEKAGKGNCT